MPAADGPLDAIIRPARPSDREAIVDLQLAVHTEIYAPPSLDIPKYVAEVRPRMLRGSWQRGPYRVAESGGRIVGVVKVVYDYVESLYVDLTVREHGIDAALLAAAERQMQAKGVGRARLWVPRRDVAFCANHGWSFSKYLGKDHSWGAGGVEVIEMNKQLCERSRVAQIVPWLLFKLAMAAVAFATLLLFGVALHDLAGMPSGITALAVLLGGFVVALITLRIRRLNLGMPRCCLIALAIVGSYLLVFMTAAGLGSLALNFLGIGERHHDGVEYAGAFLVLLIAFLSSYAPRLATPLYLRLR